MDALQEQVDDLVVQLASMKHNGGNRIPARPSTDQSCTDENKPDHHHPREIIRALNSPLGADPDTDFISRGGFTLLECEELLAKFRTHKMPQFPFVIVPTQLNVPALRQQFPFLLLCIITACLEHKPSLQHLMEQEVRKAIAIRLITNMERSMDLALGLLVHIAWYHYHRPTYHPQARMLLQIASMVVLDLGLDKEGISRMRPTLPDREVADRAGKQGGHWTPAGQRALLGCHYLCLK
ncbi:hypothetical protein AnigIFM62618_011233 [Aspergillus niger]|nr:hypothetical protein AnigIFM62618_011233 [Aspergillus niger]